MTALVIIARAPELGRVKTRLAATLGPERTLAIYCQLLARTAQAAAAWHGPVLVAATGQGTWDGTGLEGFPRVPQPDGGLGTRIAAALRAGLAADPRAIAIGTDCPGITVGGLAEVDRSLNEHDAVFGPALDGGYWAVGVDSDAAAQALADDTLPWSTSTTCEACIARCRDHGLRPARIGLALADCDDQHDYESLCADGLLDPA